MPRYSAPTVPVAKPLFRYSGGKQRLLHEIEPWFVRALEQRSDLTAYYEPFVGGCSVALLFAALNDRHRLPLRLSDANADLINIYRCVLDEPRAFKELLNQRYTDRISWLADRARFNASALQATLERAALATSMLTRGFNGLWRVNRAGHFNVPHGRYDDPPGQSVLNVLGEHRLDSFAEALRYAQFRHFDYTDVIESLTGEPPALVYFDPPYVGTTFAYGSGGRWSVEDQSLFSAACRELVERGHVVVVSQADRPEAREGLASFIVHPVSVGQSIAARAGARGQRAEIIAIGGLRC